MIGIGIRIRALTLLVSASIGLAVACTGGAGAPASASPSAPGSADPSATGSPSTAPSGGVVTVEEAVARVVAERPDLAGIGPYDPERIGGCCWYRASPSGNGYEVQFRVGWGDCPAGCIEEHTWTFQVAADGAVERVGEGGDPIPPGGVPPG